LGNKHIKLKRENVATFLGGGAEKWVWKHGGVSGKGGEPRGGVNLKKTTFKGQGRYGYFFLAGERRKAGERAGEPERGTTSKGAKKWRVEGGTKTKNSGGNER